MEKISKKKFQLCEYPWLSLLAMIAASVFSIGLTGTVLYGLFGLSDNSPTIQFTQAMMFHILTGFIIAPFVLHLPRGKRTYRQFLEDIGLSRVQPFFKLMLLALSCSLILMLSQAAASFVYRILEGQPINAYFVGQVFNLSGDLPPGSAGLFITIPSMFEEVAFRGIVLTVFLNRYSERKSIIFSSLGFGLIHLLNLSNGLELNWVLGQVFWAFILGLFYGYVFVKTRSLLPPMIVHYLGNVFIGSLSGYMQSRASINMQVVYGIVLQLGLIPTTLMILWTRFYVSRWLPAASHHELSEVQEMGLQPLNPAA